MTVKNMNDYLNAEIEKVVQNAGTAFIRGRGLDLENTIRLYILHDVKGSLENLHDGLDNYLNFHIENIREIIANDEGHDSDKIRLDILTHAQNEFHQ